MCAHRHLPVVVAVALLLCLLCVSTSAAVPAGCELDGTTLLSCAAYNATASGTRLVLRGLGITAVASSAFSGVTGVAQVDLSRNSLSLIAADTFAPLAGSITSLDLSDNKLANQGIPSDTFTPVASTLETLSLADNALASLDGLWFRLPALTQFDGSHNGVASVARGTFSASPRLSVLNLEHNKLRALPSGFLQHTTNVTVLNLAANELYSMPYGVLHNLSSLTTLDLGGNPFHKACFPSGQVERRRLGFRYCECATPTDTDGDGIEDCGDDCPTDVGRSVDEDTDFDGVPDCRVSEGGMWEVVAKLNLGLVAAGALGYGSFKVMGLLGSVCSAGAQLAPFVKTLVALAQCALLLADPVLDVASLYTFFEQEVAVAFVGCAVILAISAAFMVRLPGSPHKLLDGSFSRLVNWITRRGRPLACLRHTLAIIIMMGYWLVMFPLALATPAVELYRRDVLPAQPALWRAVRHCDCCTRRRRVRCLSGAANAAAVDMEAQGPSGTSGDADGAAGGVRTVVVTTPPAAAAPSSSNTAAKSRSPHAVDPADDGSSGSPRGGGDAAASGDGSDAAASTGREEADQGKWRRLVAMSVEAGDTVVHAQLTEALVEGLPQACLQLAQLTASAGDAGDIVVAASVAVTMLTMSLKTRVFLFVTRTKVMFVGLALLCAADGMLFFLAIATVFPAINDALQREGMHILFWPFAVDLASDAPWWAQATLWRAVMVLVLIGVCAGVTCYTDAGSRKGAVAREWRVDPWRCVCGSACASVCAMVSMAASMVLWNLLVLPLLLVVVTMTWSPLAIVVSAHLAFGDQESTLVASLHDFARSKAGLAVAVAWSAVNLTWGAVPLLMWHPGATWGWNGAANTLPRMIALVGYWECWAWGTLLTVGGACLELARKQRLGPAAALEKQ